MGERVLQVMERKQERLRVVQEKIDAYSMAKKNVEQILQKALDGVDLQEEASAAEGFMSVIQGVVNDDVNLDDKLDWPLFLRNIGIPAGHNAAKDAKRLLKEGREKWASVASRLCFKQADLVLLPKAERQRRA